MKNKKGFTLIELLAVIVILAIIMVIAVPQILEVINNSRNKAWDESVGLIGDAIELNIGLSGTGMADGYFERLGVACTPSTSNTESIKSMSTNDIIKSIAKYDNLTVTCDPSDETYTFTLTGSGQFDRKTDLLRCTETGGCSKVVEETGD